MNTVEQEILERLQQLNTDEQYMVLEFIKEVQDNPEGILFEPGLMKALAAEQQPRKPDVLTPGERARILGDEDPDIE